MKPQANKNKKQLQKPTRCSPRLSKKVIKKNNKQAQTTPSNKTNHKAKSPKTPLWNRSLSTPIQSNFINESQKEQEINLRAQESILSANDQQEERILPPILPPFEPEEAKTQCNTSLSPSPNHDANEMGGNRFWPSNQEINLPYLNEINCEQNMMIMQPIISVTVTPCLADNPGFSPMDKYDWDSIPSIQINLEDYHRMGMNCQNNTSLNQPSQHFTINIRTPVAHPYSPFKI